MAHMTIQVFQDKSYSLAQMLCKFSIAMGLALIILALLSIQITSARQAAAATPEVSTISAAVLENDYGLKVELINVSDYGGQVEFRLKVLEAHKAERLLANPAEMPMLVVPGQGTALFASAPLDGNRNLKDGETIFLMFRNREEVVKPGTFVIVNFGRLQLERIPAE